MARSSGGQGSRAYTRRQLLALASSAAGAAFLAACGASSPAPTTGASTAPASTSPAARPPTQVPVSAGGGASTATRVAGTATASSGASTPAAQAASSGRPGGTKILRVGVPGDLTQLDPALLNNQTDYQISETIFNYIGRYTYNPPLGTQVNPELAEWEVSPDARTFTFHLRKGVKFHNGNGELTAEDVRAAWEHIKDEKTASPYRNDFLDAKIDVLDPYTIRASFSRPYPAFISASLAFRPGFVVSSKAFAAAGDKWKTAPIGTGPFSFDSYQPGTSLTVKRNPDYWGKQPKIDQIQWKFRVDDRAAILAVAKGELDEYYIADPDVANSVARNPDPNVRFFKSEYGQSPWTAAFNQKRPYLADIRVRQALRYAIDNQAIARDLFGGLADPIHSFLPPFMFGYSDEIMRFEYNPDKARQLLKEANVPSSWSPSAMTVSALVISRRILEAVASYWQDIGVNVKVDIIEQGIYNQRSLSGDYDMNANYISRIDPDQIATPSFRSTTNRNGYTGADDLIDGARAEPDPAKRATLYRNLQDKISQDSPSAFVVAVSEHLIVNKRVLGEVGAGWQERHDWFNLDVPAE